MAVHYKKINTDLIERNSRSQLRLTPSLVLTIQSKGACLCDQVFIDSNILTRLLSIATFLDTSKWTLCSRRVAYISKSAIASPLSKGREQLTSIDTNHTRLKVLK